MIPRSWVNLLSAIVSLIATLVERVIVPWWARKDLPPETPNPEEEKEL